MKGDTKARYAIEQRDEFGQPSQLRITDEDGHRLFTMVHKWDSATLSWVWNLHFLCPDRDCRKELVVTLPSLFETPPKGANGERFCDCDKRRLVAVITRDGTVRTVCHKVDAHARNPHLVEVNPTIILQTVERTENREAMRRERTERHLPLGRY